MVAFLSILLAVVLLGATVYGLHRYQTMEVEYNVDRSMPLPPLQDGEGKGQANGKGRNDAELSPRTETRAATTFVNNNKAAAKSKPKPKAGQSWLADVGRLKKAGELDQAMSICEREFPLWGAYNQACIIERLQLKKTKDKQEQEETLRRLYRLAATAELLHDKSEGAEHLTPAQLKSLNLAQLADLDFAYPDLGYAHLRLIRKSDVKEMLAAWGRPEQHQLPRDIHQQWWQSFTSGVA